MSTPARARRGHQAAPIRIAAVPAALHEIVLDDVLRGDPRLIVVGRAGDDQPGDPRSCPRHRAPSACVSSSQAASSALPNSSRVGLAPPARGQHHRRVVSRGRAVDVERVEGRVGRLAQHRFCISSRGTSASVVRNASMVAMFGAIIPQPLAIPPIVKVEPLISTSFGLWSVVRMPARRVVTALDRQLLRQLRGRVEDRLHRQRRADDSGRADQHLARDRCRAHRPQPRPSAAASL